MCSVKKCFPSQQNGYRFFAKKQLDIVASNHYNKYDIVMISYNCSTADDNYKYLQVDSAKRVDGVKGTRAYRSGQTMQDRYVLYCRR